MHTSSNASCYNYPCDAAAGTLELDLPLDRGDEQEQLFGGITRKVSRAVRRTARKVGKTVAKTAKAGRPVWKTAGRVVKSAHRLSTPPGVIPLARFGRDLARGKNVWHSFRSAGRGVVNDVRAKLRYARIAAPFVPGVGTGVAAALGAADALASGRSITDAAIAAARSAVPGGAIAQTAFDVGLNLAQGRSLSTAALAAARRRLPGGPAARAAFDTAVALGRGKSLQATMRSGVRRMRLYKRPSHFLNRPTKSTYWRTRMRMMHGSAREFGDPDGLELDIGIPDEESLFSNITRSRPIAPGTNIPPYTQCDFIDEHIDVSAQYALYGMLKADAESRNASVQMLAAVKTRRIGGIYQEYQRVPALRAIKLGLGWYGPLIKKYRKSASGAARVPPAADPSHKLPIISFKKELAKNTVVLGEQLRQVYADCQLPYLEPVLPRGGDCSRPPRITPIKITPERFEQKLCVNPSKLILFDERWNRYDLSGKKVRGTFFIQSCGAGEFNLVVNSSERRLTVYPISSLARARRQRIDVEWDTRGLRVNSSYSARLVFSPREALVEEKVVSVELHIVEHGATILPGTNSTKPYQVASGTWKTSKTHFVTAHCGGRAVRFILKNLNPGAPTYVTINAKNGEPPKSNQVPITSSAIEFKNTVGTNNWSFVIDARPALAWGKLGTSDSIILWRLFCVP